MNLVFNPPFIMSQPTQTIDEIMQLAQCLTMKEIITQAGTRITGTAKRRRAELLEAVRQSAELQKAVVHAFERKQQRQAEERQTKLKKCRFEQSPQWDSADMNEEFLSNPSEEVKLQALARFIDRTDNFHTRQLPCMSCAREDFVSNMERVYLDEIPNRHLLTPIFRHHAQSLVSGMLLYHQALCTSDGRQCGPICHDCLQELNVGNIPTLSLVNGLWIGDVPHSLAILNLPERLLIALYFPAVYIVKLYPQQKGAKHWDTTALNSGIRGNVSTYQLNTADIAAMIEGQLLPHRPVLLAATIGITIIGPNKLPPKSLPPFLSVNRQRVKDALLFLKKENHLYRDITISDEHLKLLPEDGFPWELLGVVKYSDEQHLLEQEREGYVISDEDMNENGKYFSRIRQRYTYLFHFTRFESHV
jgi:hypothetical protein